MEMKNYIFLTVEGITFQPDSESSEPDIENLQVIGFAKGMNSKEGFRNLLRERSYLLSTSFDEIFSYELSQNYEASKSIHYLSESK